MFLVASLCSHSFSFTMEILPDFIQDLTETLSDLDQLSKDCLKVKVREAFSVTSLISVSGVMQESTRAKPCWKEIMLSRGWWPGLPGVMLSNPGAEYLCKFSMYL